MGRNTGSRNVLSRLNTRVRKRPIGLVSKNTQARNRRIWNQPLAVILGYPGSSCLHLNALLPSCSDGDAATLPTPTHRATKARKPTRVEPSKLLRAQQCVDQINSGQHAYGEHDYRFEAHIYSLSSDSQPGSHLMRSQKCT